MAITASLVKELRDSTGAGMMDAKKALTETSGAMQQQLSSIEQTTASINLTVSDIMEGTASMEANIAAILLETGSINLSVQQQQEFSESLSGSTLMSFINIDPFGVQISGSALHFSGSEFFLGSSSNYISGADGNMEIKAKDNFTLSSSTFELDTGDQVLWLGSGSTADKKYS